jgi:ubiquinone/menaquinone biosynthesis C-methylase UbiE
MNKQYPLAVGEADRLRLERLNKLYNPLSQYFLIQNGLRRGMTVLEVGCGAGDMACWLAKTVGPAGRVVAIDSSSEQIAICEGKANSQGFNNIKFYCMDVRKVETLKDRFDMSYGRWVISFTPDPLSVFEKILSILKPGGVLNYETASYLNEGYFSSPETPVVAQWFEYGLRALGHNFSMMNLGAKLYQMFIDLGLSAVDTLVNQPILKTPEEKSVLRLAAITTKEHLLKVMSEKTYEQYIRDLEIFEQSDSIAGFYRNILVSGIKRN